MVSLQVKNLVAFRQQQALFEPIYFELDSKQILHITGNNGAGKSTLLMTLAGLLPLHSAQIIWQDQLLHSSHDLSYLNNLFYLGHQIALKNQLTVKENLQFFKQLHFCHTIEEHNLFDHLNIDALKNTYCQQLSAGQKQRAALTRLWMTRAKLWLLDEPFNSLDKNSVAKVIAKMAEHCEMGGMIIMTSHQTISWPQSISVKSMPL